MSNILKSTKLDIALVKPYFKTICFTLLLPIVFAAINRSLLTGVSFAMCFIAMTTGYTFSITEKNSMDRLFGILPVRKSELVIGTPTPSKSTTAKIVKSIQSPHISLFFIIRMDKKIETAYITTIAKTAKKTRSIGKDSTTEIIDFPIAGILERRSKVTKKPATGIYINTRPLIEPYL
jgi:hypothetical protein